VLVEIEADGVAAPRKLRGSLLTVHRSLRAGESPGEQQDDCRAESPS
jgi:hypothetical protein